MSKITGVGRYIDMEHDEDVIRGHVSREEFRAEMLKFNTDSEDIEGVEHKHARWVPDRGEKSGFDLLFIYCEPGRGAFPVTVGC